VLLNYYYSKKGILGQPKKNPTVAVGFVWADILERDIKEGIKV
jgi:hypothetical protein